MGQFWLASSPHKEHYENIKNYIRENLGTNPNAVFKWNGADTNDNVVYLQYSGDEALEYAREAYALLWFEEMAKTRMENRAVISGEIVALNNYVRSTVDSPPESVYTLRWFFDQEIPGVPA